MPDNNEVRHESTPRWVRAIEIGRLRPAGHGTFVGLPGNELAVFALPDSRYVVTDNACPHANGNLSGGCVSDGVVECPWHQWRFDLESGACLHNRRIAVRTYPCEVRGPDLWVNLAPNDRAATD